MWLVWIAILILFILVFFFPSREGLTSQQLYEIQRIIDNPDIKPDDKIKELYGDNASVDIEDIPIINILKNKNTFSQEKIDALNLYFINLVNQRNNNENSKYKTVVDKISNDKFFNLNNIINNPDLDDSEKLDEIKSIGIKEKTFTDIKTISDEENPSGNVPTFYSLINEVLNGTFISDSSTNS